MKFRFSFSHKKELIFIEEKPQMSEPGALLKNIIDTEWTAQKNYIKTLYHKYLDTSSEEEALFLIKYALKDEDLHPAIAFSLQNSEDYNQLNYQLERLEECKNVVLYVLEFLVDEEQSLYEERLCYLFADENCLYKEFFNSLGSANILSVRERNKSMYYQTEDFPYLFETDDLVVLAIQQLQYICSNQFYIRKCAHCKKFLWTRKMNKVYCDRVLSPRGKTCAQIGPAKLWNNNNSKAYALYWSYRKRLFNRATVEGNDYRYTQWLIETEDYKEKAKNNQIPYEVMKQILDKIEQEIYTQALCM